MTNEEIKTLALYCGFTERPQENGEMDLNPYVYESHKKAYDMGFADGSKHSDWVPCRERLPSNSGEYLVYCVGNMDFAKDRKVRSVMLFNAKGNIWAGLSPIFKVTHWQPLAQPPSEVQT